MVVLQVSVNNELIIHKEINSHSWARRAFEHLIVRPAMAGGGCSRRCLLAGFCARDAAKVDLCWTQWRQSIGIHPNLEQVLWNIFSFSCITKQRIDVVIACVNGVEMIKVHNSSEFINFLMPNTPGYIAMLPATQYRRIEWLNIQSQFK